MSVQSVPEANIRDTMHHVGALVADAEVQLADVSASSDDEATMEWSRIDRAMHGEALVGAINSHTFPPVALGLGKTAIEDKVVAHFVCILFGSWHGIVGLLPVQFRELHH